MAGTIVHNICARPNLERCFTIQRQWPCQACRSGPRFVRDDGSSGYANALGNLAGRQPCALKRKTSFIFRIVNLSIRSLALSKTRDYPSSGLLSTDKWRRKVGWSNRRNRWPNQIGIRTLKFIESHKLLFLFFKQLIHYNNSFRMQ